MGFAITRGATCLVAAADEIFHRRGVTRLLALAEAAIWVAAGLSVAALAGFRPMAPIAHGIGLGTVAGGALLGAGAYVNRACVFGAVARLGGGEWHYLATPVGFLAGCLAIEAGSKPAAAPLMAMAPFPVLPGSLLLALLLFALVRGGGLALAARRGSLSERLWSPHHATGVIGITFVILMLAAGAWTYPDALIQLARGMTMQSGARLILFLGLLGGAMAGGRGKPGSGSHRCSPEGVLRCLAGGALMGLGSLLIPGGNDNLILVGLPFLLPHAWLAIGIMLITIWGCMALSASLSRALAPAKAGR
jgi:toxin CptA